MPELARTFVDKCFHSLFFPSIFALVYLIVLYQQLSLPYFHAKSLLNIFSLLSTVPTIGHFEKYHNTLCLSPQILHKHCFQFLLGITMVPRENKNNAYEKFGGTNKEYYGIFRSGLLLLRIHFLRVVLINTGIFLRDSKLCGESRT